MVDLECFKPEVGNWVLIKPYFGYGENVTKLYGIPFKIIKILDNGSIQLNTNLPVTWHSEELSLILRYDIYGRRL